MDALPLACPGMDPDRVRSATPADAAACLAVYTPYVEQTAVSFEEHPPSVEEMRTRIEAALRTHAWVVLEDDGGRITGYAYAGPYKSRPAYRWSCEVSVYVEPGRRRTGAGRALYGALFERLVERGFVVAVAGMTLPNPASAGLHRCPGVRGRRHLARHRPQGRRLARRALDAADAAAGRLAGTPPRPDVTSVTPPAWGVRCYLISEIRCRS